MLQIPCQIPRCTYIAEHASEAVVIALLGSHNNVHQQPVSTSHMLTKQKVPRIERPELKQDITDEDWYSFEVEWQRFKWCTDIPAGDVADQLFQCCDRALGRLLLKENPAAIQDGETALMVAIKIMAVIHVATSVRRANLLATKQDHGESIREYYANIRAAASTCNFNVQCPHTCCNDRDMIDYTPMVVKDILIAGIADNDIRKDVLSWAELDEKSDKDIVRFIEEKEIAKNAYSGNLATAAGMSSYMKSNRNGDDENKYSVKKKLAMKGKCSKCSSEIFLYTKYRSGKLNNDPFQMCLKCFKGTKAMIKQSQQSKDNAKDQKHSDSEYESSAITSFIGALDVHDYSIAEQSSRASVKSKPPRLNEYVSKACEVVYEFRGWEARKRISESTGNRSGYCISIDATERYATKILKKTCGARSPHFHINRLGKGIITHTSNFETQNHNS